MSKFLKVLKARLSDLARFNKRDGTVRSDDRGEREARRIGNGSKG